MNLQAAVIGTVFIDCKGFASQRYVPDGRNLGAIRFVHGGVGRNVAENMAMLGIPVSFLSSVDGTPIGQDVLDRLIKRGVSVQSVVSAAQGGMGMWLAVLDEHGALAGSISQMPDLDHIAEAVRKYGEHCLSQASHVALELDLNDELSAAILEMAAKHRKPVYGIPGNLDVIRRNPHMLGQLSCFICNHIEAQQLIGTDFSQCSNDAAEAVLRQYCQSSGLSSIVVTLGSEGAVYYDGTAQQFGCQSVFPVQVVDTSGAGDAFFSGTVMGLMRGLDLANAVVCGTKTAGWTIGSAENTCAELTAHAENDELLKPLLTFGH